MFLRHLFSTWNRYRHRMAPESAKIIHHLKEKGQLVMLDGKVINTERADQDVFHVKYIGMRSKEVRHLLADLVFNCTGPEYVLEKRKDPLMQKLLLKSVIEPDSLRMGLKTEPGRLLLKTSFGSKNFYALGAHLFGERFETTAVPEIREQAARVADEIISQLISYPAGE